MSSRNSIVTMRFVSEPAGGASRSAVANRSRTWDRSILAGSFPAPRSALRARRRFRRVRNLRRLPGTELGATGAVYGLSVLHRAAATRHTVWRSPIAGRAKPAIMSPKLASWVSRPANIGTRCLHRGDDRVMGNGWQSRLGGRCNPALLLGSHHLHQPRRVETVDAVQFREMAGQRAQIARRRQDFGEAEDLLLADGVAG